MLSKRALRYRREGIVCARTKSCDHVYRLVIDWDEYIDFCFSRKFLFLSLQSMKQSRPQNPFPLTFWIKSNKNLQNLPCFILLSVFISFSSISNWGTFEILAKTSLTDIQNSHKEEASDEVILFSHILFSSQCDLSSSWCPLDESYLQEIWLDHILDSGDLFSDDRGERRESDRFTMECIEKM